MKNMIYEKDIENTLLLLKKTEIKNSRILVTGATGMICSCVVDILMKMNAEQGTNNMIYASGRSIDRLRARFERYHGSECLKFLRLDTAVPFELDIDVDYIIHGASNADPASMMQNPVETLKSNIIGIDTLLAYGVQKKVRRILYISSGEVYGSVKDGMPQGFSEHDSGYIDYSKPRVCYPSGKRAAEALCQCYISQYKSDVVIVRPCHIYGPTMLWSDSRAISAFIRNGINGENIVMKSDGTLVRSHCYVVDAAAAILFVLIHGNNGQAYNIADKNSVCSIAELAHIIAKEAGTEVKFDLPTGNEAASFSKVNRAVLDASKLEALGWSAQTNLADGIHKTIEILKHNKKEGF